MASKETVLVTGGAGFIGSHVVEALLRKGCAVRVLDNFSTGQTANLDPVLDRVDLHNGDIRSRPDVDAALRGIQKVVHLAALHGTARSTEEPLEVHAANVDGTLTLLEAACDARALRRFVYASAGSVYGDGPPRRREDSDAWPASCYGVSKLAAEQYALQLHRTRGLPVVCLRLFTVYGPRQDATPPYAAVVPSLLQPARQSEPFSIHGAGQQMRDPTFVGDAVQAILAALVRPKAVGRVLNISGGRPVTVLEIARATAKAADIPCQVKFMPPRLADSARVSADLKAARAVLGYAPKVALGEGLSRTCEWFERSGG